ncbi:MAG: HAD family phosphatase [Bacteroidales bacterium]|jgi:putative hydrolase of the HAD superfamily|nr:HAD family phosphatase [Bacteroidales bacterium]
MIRNLVFDLGNVLLSWKPAEYLENEGYNPERAKEIAGWVFGSEAWKSLDNGDISEDEAINQVASDTSLSRAETASLFKAGRRIIFPLDENIKVLPALKKQGFKLFYLSNFPLDFFNEIRGRYSFFEYFDGGFISAEVRQSKPDPEIYRTLLDRYGLVAGECLYIDDIEINANAAATLGMQTIHLRDHRSLRVLLAEFVEI